MKGFSTCWMRALLAIMLGSVTTSAYSHTTLRNQFYVAENATDYDFVQPSHGCFPQGPANSTVRSPIKGSSVVFPTGSDALVQYFPAELAVTYGWGNPANPATAGLVAQVKTGVLKDNFQWTYHTGAIMDLSGVADILTTMPDKSVFSNWRKKYIGDSNGNNGAVPVGFEVYGGPAQDGYSTLAYPVKFGGIKFKTASCAKSLTIRIAVADFCSNKWPVADGSANVWINHTTPKFANSDVDGIAPAGTPANFWPAISVFRNLTTNPLPASCGKGQDWFVTPSDAQIDRDLPIKGVWGK